MLIVVLLNLLNTFISWQTNVPAGLQHVCTYGSTDLWAVAGDLPFHWTVHTLDLYKRAVVNGEPAPWPTPGSPSNFPSAGHTNSERGVVNLSPHSQSQLSHRCFTCTHLWHAVMVTGEVKDEFCLLKHGWSSRPKKHPHTNTHARSLNWGKIALHRRSPLNKRDLPSGPAELWTCSAEAEVKWRYWQTKDGEASQEAHAFSSRWGSGEC